MAVLAYKAGARSTRALVEENPFALGMLHTDNTLPAGYVRDMINLDYSDIHGSLKNRGGLRTLSAPLNLKKVYNLVAENGDGTRPVVAPVSTEPVQAFGPYEVSVRIIGKRDLDNPLGALTEVTGTSAMQCWFIPAQYTASTNSNKFGELPGYAKLDGRTPDLFHLEYSTFILYDPVTQRYSIAPYNQVSIEYNFPHYAVLQEFKDALVEDAGKTYSKVGWTNDKFVTHYKELGNTLPMAAINGDLYLFSMDMTHEFIDAQPSGTKHTGFNWSTGDYYDSSSVMHTRPLFRGITFYSILDEQANQQYYCFDIKEADELALPRTITAADALVNGYNYLCGEDAHTFTNNAVAIKAEAGVTGAAFYKTYTLSTSTPQYCTAVKDPIVSPILGKRVAIAIAYDYLSTASDITIKVEHCVPGSTVWVTAGNRSNANNGGLFAYPITITSEVTQFRVTMYHGSTADPNNIVSITTFNIAATKDNNVLQTYQLSTAKGMINWQNRLVCWGVVNAESALFLSKDNNPTYFPDTNLTTFDEIILGVKQYMDGILVFTPHKIYKVVSAYGEDGSLVFTSTVVQSGMSFTPEDMQYLQIIRNMVIFRSRGMFYMVVPKAESLTKELTIAPISKPMQQFFAQPAVTLQDWFSRLYGIPVKDTDDLPSDLSRISLSADYTYAADDITKVTGIKPFYTYVDTSTVHFLYRVQITFTPSTQPQSIAGGAHVWLNYDTTTRVWSVYIMAAPLDTSVLALRPNNINDTHVLHVYRVGNTPTLKVMYFSQTKQQDSTVSTLNVYAPAIMKYLRYPNYAYLDTGNRQQTEGLKKRFREVQLRMLNDDNSVTQIGTSFILDGDVRTDYGTLSPVYDAATNTYQLDYSFTTPDISLTDVTRFDTWTLDRSQFPNKAPVHIRIPVSGKGYAPRLQIKAFTETPFELTNIAWVYRPMNGR